MYNSNGPCGCGFVGLRVRGSGRARARIDGYARAQTEGGGHASTSVRVVRTPKFAEWAAADLPACTLYVVVFRLDARAGICLKGRALWGANSEQLQSGWGAL